MEKETKKIKVLAFLDSPACFSGFAQVARNILMELHNTGEYEIVVFGINHTNKSDSYGRPQPHEYPFEILEASYLSNEDRQQGRTTDPYGKYKLLKYMFENKFDIFFSVQDPFVVDFIAEGLERLRKKGRKFRSIYYFPVDAYNIPKVWGETASRFDFPVVYTHFGLDQLCQKLSPEEMKKFQMPIPHGTNVTDFKVLENRDDLKKRFFPNKYVVLNVNRNQPRKDPVRSLAVFAEFKKLVPEAVFLYHCNPFDIGNDLVKELKYYDLELNKDVFFPVGMDGKSKEGLPISEINEAYNLGDVLISTTLGEGWGLSTTEAMACKLPLVIPRNTSSIEIVGEKEERGYLADCGNNLNMWAVNQRVKDEPPRPLTDIYDMVKKMKQVYDDQKAEKFEETETYKKVEEAFKYAQENTWADIVKNRWLPLFVQASTELVTEKESLEKDNENATIEPDSVEKVNEVGEEKTITEEV